MPSAANPAEVFVRAFGREPHVVTRAPGRVNLIGEHTDYTGGLVLPMAIDRETRVAMAPRRDTQLDARAATLDERASIDLAYYEPRPDCSTWIDYIAGVAHLFWRDGRLTTGIDVAVTSNVPMGSGLSSSAALEMAVLRALEGLVGFALSDADAVRLGQRVEHAYIGVQSGIMDQYAVRAARRDHALLLDCRSVETRQVPIRLPGCAFVVADTRAPRSLAQSAYNDRVRECSASVERLRAVGVTVDSLRGVSPAMLETIAPHLDEALLKRARHVATENARVLEAVAAIEAGDAAALGACFSASHRSLRDDYEVSSEPLDCMVHVGEQQAGCLGARMTGAGFGGCTVHLVESDAVASYRPAVARAYRETTGIAPDIYVVAPSDGARQDSGCELRS